MEKLSKTVNELALKLVCEQDILALNVNLFLASWLLHSRIR